MRIFSALYDKILALASRDDAIRYLAAVSFAEASILPVPADVMLAPMVLADPNKAFGYARVATCFSIVGGLLGYVLGYFAFHPIIEPLLQAFGYEASYYKVLELFRVWGFWLLCALSCIPIPYKFFTISAGVLQYNIFLFFVASCIARSIRFHLVSVIVRAGGKKMEVLLRRFIDRLGWGVVGIIILYMLYKLSHHLV